MCSEQETHTKQPEKNINETPPISTNLKDQRKSEENSHHDVTEKNPYKMEIVWSNVIVFFMIHLGALYAIHLGLSKAKFLTPVFGVFLVYFTGLSLSIGAHRFYSHRSFKANKYIQVILMLVHTMTAQWSLLTWVRDHRTHHKYSDTNADPHNSNRGFFFSYIGWLMVRRHPDVIRKGETIDISDLKRDPIVMFQKNHYLKIFFVFGVVLPTSIPCLMWNETIWNSFFISVVFRIVGSWTITWFINAIAHVHGSKPYTKNISPGENPIVSFLILGEAMHNYHHTFPWDYRGAERNNISSIIIDYWIKNGWVYDAKSVSGELIKRQAMKKGDGSHPVYNKLNPNGVLINENY